MPNQSLIVGWRKRWNRSLLQFLRRRLRTSVDIEDLAQETYVRLLRTHDLSEVRNPQAYILRVAGHVIAEWRERQPPEDPLSLVDDSFLMSGADAEGEIEAQSLQAQFDQALLKVPPAMRAVLLLRFRDNCSQKEIVERLGMTDRQVRRHLIRGYEYLRQWFRNLNGSSLHE